MQPAAKRPEASTAASASTVTTAQISTTAVMRAPSTRPAAKGGLEDPITEFTDLEELAQEIAEITQNADFDQSNTVIEGREVTTSESFSLKQEPTYGVVENFQPKFITTNVEKRPLSPSYVTRPAQSAPSPAQPQTERPRIGRAKRHKAGQAEPVATSVASATRPAQPLTTPSAAASTPRPAQPTTATAKAAQPTKPKSELGQRLKMIGAIILTVILGAVVGSIAFLLLPN